MRLLRPGVLRAEIPRSAMFVHISGRKTFERALRGLPQCTRISGPGLFRHRTHLDRFPRTQTGLAFRRRGVRLCPHSWIRAAGVLGAMKGKERDLGRSSGMITQIISATFWLYIAGLGLLALFQVMPAAAYLRRNRRSFKGGDRHVS